MLGSFILRWWATEVADLNLQCISSNLAFSCNALTFLCFLEAFPASLVALQYGFHGVTQGLWYCTKCDEKYERIMRDHFYRDAQSTGETNCSPGGD